MPILRHKTPCNECPFRRASAPGYLGDASPAEFIEAALSEHHMPCHCSIDYEKEDWISEQYPQSSFCAGSLIFLRNTCKLPMDPILREARVTVEQDSKNVFGHKGQFLEHHLKFRIF